MRRPPLLGIVLCVTLLQASGCLTPHLTHAQPAPDPAAEAKAELDAANKANSDQEWETAIGHWTRALELYRAQQGSEKRQAICLLGMGMAYRGLQKHAECIAALTEALALLAPLPETEQHRAVCLFFLGQSHYDTGQYEQSMEAFTRAVELYAQMDGAGHSQAETLYNLALSCGELGLYERQVAALEQALELYGAGEDTARQRADCLKQLGTALGGLGRLQREIEVSGQALDLYRGMEGTEADQADCLLNIGAAHGYLGDHARKIGLTNEALALYRTLPDTDVEQALCLHNLGVAYGYLGEHQRSIQLCQQALELLRRHEGTEVHQAGCLRSLGAAYGDVGQDEQLIQYTIQALELFRKLPHSEFGQASCLNNLGVAYGRLKQHEARIRVTEQALELYRKLEGTEADQAGCLQNLANAYSFLGQTDKMVEFTKQALALYQTVQGTEADRADCHINLGVAYRDTGDLEGSARSFLEAQSIFRGLGRGGGNGGVHWLPPAMYAVEAGLAKTRWKQGDLYAAYRHLARAVSIVEHLRGRAGTTLSLKTSYFAQMAWVYDDLVGLLRDMQAQGLPVDVEKLQEAEPSFWEDFGLPVPRLWRDWDSFAEAMIHYSEGARARALQDMLANEPLSLADRGTRQLWARLNDLIRQERQLQAELAQASGRQDEQTQALWVRYQQVWAERQRVEMDFSSTGLGRLAEAPDSKLSDWQGLLGEGQAVVEYKVLGDRTLCWLITRQGISVHEAPVDEGILFPSIEALADRWLGRTPEQVGRGALGLLGLVALAREPIQALAEGKSPLLQPDEHLRALALLYDLLLRPVVEDPAAQGISHLIIVPDSSLYYLPFAALVSRLPEDISDVPGGFSYAHRELEYAIDRWDISTLPSLSMHLAMTRLSQERGEPGQGLCAFADPVFSPQDNRLKGADTTLEAARLLWHSGVSPAGAMEALAGVQDSRGTDRGDVTRLQRLPFSYLEMEYALNSFGADTSRDICTHPEPLEAWATQQGFAGLGADESRVLDPRLRRYGEVLISTHGVIDLNRPMYSYLAFTSSEALAAAGAAPPAGAAELDGSLSLPELFGMQMNARIVTLSACRTGLGAYSAGEGMLGLSLAVFYAGARAMTVSLWSVDDARTAKLIARNHALLAQGKAPLDALLTAQREMLALGRKAVKEAGDELVVPERADPTDDLVCLDPYYWAAFQLAGQW